jgi:phage shock protein A
VALNKVFDNSGINTAGRDVVAAAPYVSGNRLGLAASNGLKASGVSPSGVEGRAIMSKDAAGSDLLTIAGIGAALFTAAVVFSKPFRGYVARVWQMILGAIGLGVKNAEKNNPELIAQRVIDELNAAKPEYAKRVAQASSLVKKIEIQIRNEKAKHAELEKTITALLSDDNEENDVYAATMLQQQKTLESSIKSSEEQFEIGKNSVAEIKADRARFFMEREQMLAEINAMLARNKQAEMKKKMAELKGSFDSTDLRGNMDRLKDIVDENEADAAGMKDSVDSNPDEIIRKAKDDLMSAEVKSELARRKAAIKAKQEGKSS